MRGSIFSIVVCDKRPRPSRDWNSNIWVAVWYVPPVRLHTTRMLLFRRWLIWFWNKLNAFLHLLTVALITCIEMNEKILKTTMLAFFLKCSNYLDMEDYLIERNLLGVLIASFQSWNFMMLKSIQWWALKLLCSWFCLLLTLSWSTKPDYSRLGKCFLKWSNLLKMKIKGKFRLK